jgi:hypothetical protein
VGERGRVASSLPLGVVRAKLRPPPNVFPDTALALKAPDFARSGVLAKSACNLLRLFVAGVERGAAESLDALEAALKLFLVGGEGVVGVEGTAVAAESLVTLELMTELFTFRIGGTAGDFSSTSSTFP